MERAEIAALIERAIQRIIDQERDLLDRDVSERTLADHLARFIRDDLGATFSVDVEYNRHGDDPKRLTLPPRDRPDEKPQTTIVSPDIVVHVRGTDEHNLLVLEVKKPGESIEYDERKLRAFREQLRYCHAAHVILGRDADDEIIQDVIWID